MKLIKYPLKGKSNKNTSKGKKKTKNNKIFKYRKTQIKESNKNSKSSEEEYDKNNAIFQNQH